MALPENTRPMFVPKRLTLVSYNESQPDDEHLGSSTELPLPERFKA
jgi:hypothetical protein